MATTASLLVFLVAAGVAFVGSLSSNAAPTILMAAVLIVAVAFGLIQGLLAGIVALLACWLLGGAPLAILEQGAGDLPLMVLFGLGAIVAGRYTDIVRKRNHHARLVLQAAKPLSLLTSEPELGRFLARVKPEGRLSQRPSALEEAQRALLSFCIVAGGLAISLFAQGALGPVAAVLCALAAPLVAGGLLGARFGFAAGLLSAGLLSQFIPVQEPYHLKHSLLAPTFVLIAFSGAGWIVGRLADQLQQERRAFRTIVHAERDFAEFRDERAVRGALLDILAQLSPRARVEIVAESGAEVARVSPVAGQPWTEGDPRWRVHALASGGRDVGLVRWRFPGHDRTTAGRDETARAVSDLAASAIVRARLNAEKADMELAAQTEHLRLVLLDAVSHQFRSPLAGILGSVTSALDLSDDEFTMRRELLLIIKDQTNKLSRHVDNFISVGRLETGAIVPRITSVALEPLIYDVWEKFGDIGGARRFLQASIVQDALQTDASLLAQALGNVLENAIKYSPEGSVVDVTTETNNDHLTIRIIDCGPGIAPQNHARIFERFYRARGVAAPGLGLGLYITRSLVEVLGGTVEARNRADGQTGLAVSLSLPQGAARG